MPALAETRLQRTAFRISDMPAGRAQFGLAATTLGVLLVACVAITPFVAIPLPGSGAALPAYAAALFFIETVTAAMLMAMFSAFRRPDILLLAAGYLFSALLVVPWVLTFPAGTDSDALVPAGLQTTAAISALRRLGFPLFILGYAFNPTQPREAPGRHHRPWISLTIVGTVAAVAGLVWLCFRFDDAMPQFMSNPAEATKIWLAVPSASAVLLVVAGVRLWSRRRTVLDLWLLVVVATLLIEIALIGFLSGGRRLSLGWWAGRLLGLTSSSTVLIVLLASMTTIYARLLRSIAIENRHHATRLATMEALAAAIAHELNQPLASAVTNANAARRWLDRPQPDLVEALAALQRIKEDGLRGAQVIESLRALFAKHGRERRPLDINALIAEVIARSGPEAELEQIAIRIELDPDLPPVNGNPVQLQQVVANLIVNAFEAMAPATGRARELTVSSRRSGTRDVIVRVADTGIGLNPAARDRVLEPFFTTKAHGMGMGLTICTSILESHGGRLWATDCGPAGAVFEFSVPAAVEEA
jgi:signal transduction histidine kinase